MYIHRYTMHGYIYTHAHTHARTHRHTQTHTYTHMHIHTHAHAHTHTHTHAPVIIHNYNMVCVYRGETKKYFMQAMNQHDLMEWLEVMEGGEPVS